MSFTHKVVGKILGDKTSKNGHSENVWSCGCGFQGNKQEMKSHMKQHPDHDDTPDHWLTKNI